MRYFGGKARIAKELSAYLNAQLQKDQPFVDLFCGSCNVISKIDPNRQRFANDLHPDLIALFVHLQTGGELPSEVSEGMYKEVKAKGEPWLRGFVGFGCSFAGKFFGGFARDNRAYNYAEVAKSSLSKKTQTLKDVKFSCGDYSSLSLPENALVYCDIPYKGTTGYSTGSFDHLQFYRWVRANKDKRIFVSEYKENTPEDFEIVLEIQSKKEIRDKVDQRVTTTEVLIKLKS